MTVLSSLQANLIRCVIWNIITNSKIRHLRGLAGMGLQKHTYNHAEGESNWRINQQS